MKIELRILDGNKGRCLSRQAGLGVLEHVRMGVDQARKYGFLAEVNYTCAIGDSRLCSRSNLSDTIIQDQHDLVAQHLARLTVE
jgi:hypothetical protein